LQASRAFRNDNAGGGVTRHEKTEASCAVALSHDAEGTPPRRHPRHLLDDLYLVRAAKEALALGVCPECRKPQEVIDTWERACPDPVCGYTFNLCH
jgi:hypothetical protein